MYTPFSYALICASAISLDASIRSIAAKRHAASATFGAVPPSAPGNTWCAMVSIWIFLMSSGVSTSLAAVAAPSSVYTEAKPSRSSAWFGETSNASSAKAAAARREVVTHTSPSLVLSAARLEASAHRALTPNRANVSPGVGSLGSAFSGTSLRHRRYFDAKSCAASRPVFSDTFGRDKPRTAALVFTSRETERTSRQDPPYLPKEAYIDAAATQRRALRFAAVFSSESTSNKLKACCVEFSVNLVCSVSQLLSGLVPEPDTRQKSRMRSAYGARSRAHDVHAPNSCQ